MTDWLPIRWLRAFFGIDEAVAYTLLWRVWMFLSSAGTVLLVSRYLTVYEQGYYFTFQSLVNVRMVFELGLSLVILQCASHEMAKLRWSETRTLAGDDTARFRLLTISQVAMKWYSVVALMMAVVVIPAGVLLFRHPADGSVPIAWLAPWACLVIATAGLLLVTPLLSVLEGSGRIVEVTRMRAHESMVSTVGLWIALTLGLRLWALPIFAVIAVTYQGTWLFSNYTDFLRQVGAFQLIPGILSWKKEVWPFQWRIALSFLSGYCVFNLFNPIVFRLVGPAEAGRIGLSLLVAQGILTLASSNVKTKAPRFGALIAHRDFAGLDSLFGKTLRQTGTMVLVMCGGFFGVVLYLAMTHHPLAGRILPPVPIAFLLGATIGNSLIQAYAIYLRAHKEEPLLWSSLVSTFVTIPATYWAVKYWGSLGAAIAFFAITIALNGAWTAAIFIIKRREWHTEDCVGSLPLSEVVPEMR